jgi:PilZ domain
MPAERRAKARFPVEMNVRYRTVTGGLAARSGVGRTLNVSSRGLLIASEEDLVEDGTRLKISLEWPARLQGGTPLQLIAVCRVIRCQPDAFAVRLERYQFRTRKLGILRVPPLYSPHPLNSSRQLDLL